MMPAVAVDAWSGFSGVTLVWLADASIKAAVLLAGAGVLALVFRRAAAAWRHLVWRAALVGTLLVPVASPILPALPVPARMWYELSAARPETAASGSPVDMALEGAGFSPAPPSDSSVARPIASAVAHPVGAAIDVWTLGLGVWLAGAILVLVRLTAGLMAVRRIVRGAREIKEPAWLQLAAQASDRIDLTRPVRLLESARVRVPMTWGASRPAVVLPVEARDWAEDRRRAVLLHELAHVWRGDWWAQVVAQVACAAYWFNPLVWVGAHRLRVERERACDDQVLRLGTRASDYAAHLLAIAQASRHPGLPDIASIAMARRSELEGRLLAILDPSVRRAVSRTGSIALVSVAVSVTGLVAAARPSGPGDRPPAGQGGEVVAIWLEAEREVPGLAIPPAVTAPRREADPGAAGSSGHVEAQAAGPNAALSAEARSDEPPQGPPEEPVGVAAPPTATDPSSRIVDALLNALEDPSSDIREQAAAALGRTPDDRALNALIDALDDAHPDVRERAAWALGTRRDPRAVDALVAVLQDPEPGVQEQAAWALGVLKDPRAVPGLSTVLDSAGEDAQAQAARALGAIRDRRAVAPLLRAFETAAPEVRRQVAWALGAIRDPEAVEALVLALKDADHEVRRHAAWSLGAIREARGVEGLIGALKDNDRDVRRHAAWSLGAIRDLRATDALVEAIEDEDEDVRRHAFLALSRLSESAGHPDQERP